MDRQASERFMRLAADKARTGVRQGQTPFGACLVKEGEVLALAHNRVWSRTDITAHAEVTAIREACRKRGTIDLSETVLYSTCEPCPMCFAAAHWARIGTIVFGASIADAERFGFRELSIPCEKLHRLGNSSIKLHGGFLRNECLEVFRAWSLRPDRRVY